MTRISFIQQNETILLRLKQFLELFQLRALPHTQNRNYSVIKKITADCCLSLKYDST